MATNLDIPHELLSRAKELGGHRSKKAAAIAALEAYVRRIEQQRAVELFGAVDYDHKARRTASE